MDNWVINYQDLSDRYQSFECWAYSLEDAMNQFIHKEAKKVSLITEIFKCDSEEA